MSWYWEDVSDIGGAEKAMTGGCWAAGFVAGVTALLAGLSLFGMQVLGINAWALTDAALFGGIAFGIHRKSRVAAVAGLCLYLLERIYMISRTGAGAIAFGILLTLLFINAVRGAFAYHRLAGQGQQARPLAP